MLFAHPSLQSDDRRVLDRISQMRHDLRYFVVQEPRRWTGLLARMTRARALRASNSIEDINVSAEDALAVVDNEDVTDADKATYQAVQGYHNAMDFVLQRCKTERFHFSEDFILAIHFMICQHDMSANPGSYRKGWVGVRNAQSGEIVHEGVDREKLEPLMVELVDYMNDPNVESTVLKGAMAHLNLTLLHPFKDGNGRTARCLQSAVLADRGILAPVFSSIEEYIGRTQQEYYDVLAETGGGGWNPERDCTRWVRYCITGHYRQAQTLLRRTQEFSRLYDDLLEIVRKADLPERSALGLLQAAVGGKVRNASYRVSADISNNLASRDLKGMVDAGLLSAEGEKRGRHYVAGRDLSELRRKTRLPKPIGNPFEDSDIVGPT